MPQKHRPPPILSVTWLEQKFESLHQEHLLILKKLEEPTHVTEELEKQIVKLVRRATLIDNKVPD